jgi:hypothetical protein
MSGIHLALLGMNFGPTEFKRRVPRHSGGGAGGAYAGGGQVLVGVRVALYRIAQKPLLLELLIP